MYGNYVPYATYGHYAGQVYPGALGCAGNCYGCYGGWSCYGTSVPLHPQRFAPVPPSLA